MIVGIEDFNGSQPITIISFLVDYRMPCYNGDVQEDAAMWLLPYLLRGTVKSSYYAWVSSPKDARRNHLSKDQKVTTYPEAVHYLLSAYATTDAIHVADKSVRHLHQHRFSVQE